MKFRTRAAVTVVALPMILGVAACGGGDKATGDQAGGGTTPSASVTSSTPTATPSSTPVAPPAAQEPLRLTNASFLPALKAGTGQAKSWKAKTVMTAGGQKITMTSAQTTSPLAMKLEMALPAADGAVQMILVGSNLYLSIPQQTPAGKFVKLDLKNSKDPAVKQYGELLQNADPMKSYKGWDKSLQSVKFVKTETIGGRELDRYDVTVDTAKALKAMGQQIPAGTAGVPKTLVYSTWMGSDKLIYQMKFEMPGVSMLMTMSDYNQPVAIAAPPASKIVAKR
ncbi:hypothetical protein [Kribbella sp. CA-293567]|uniref:hypothetical protein n=1 Tax=Kribbella sp. CA-293567 TaxID=3002436 RepID=UPI0022DE5257|nr:hypothetical protein [Kribbella sp. CA-293567]WBQ05769.1 hypothetical protein OX958_02945 [Kribbella sp. CA-293567]